VLRAYNIALTNAFILPIAVGGIALICSFFVSAPPPATVLNRGSR
jgi:hypothetical protein